VRAGEKLADESGFSLVEILITVVIVGIAFAAILGGLMVSITASALHRKEATADALVRSAAEWVKDDSRNPYDSSNAGPGSYSPLPAGFPIPGGFLSPTIDSVECWDGSAVPSGSPYILSSSSHFSAAACTASDAGLQLIRITAASADGQARETVELLKRVVR